MADGSAADENALCVQYHETILIYDINFIWKIFLLI
jgi:hypothetical protein